MRMVLIMIAGIIIFGFNFHTNDTQITTTNQKIEKTATPKEALKKNKTITKKKEKFIKVFKMKATAYDLSVQSCGKKKNHPQYGITNSRIRAKVGRTIAVDPKVIKLGTKVYVEFKSKSYQYLNGYYIAEDTGRLIKGKRIDIFMGELCIKKCFKFGIRDCIVKVMR